MTRLGLYTIHNLQYKLVKSFDVPWDFTFNAPDGAVIEPNPIPPDEEIQDENFEWNDRNVEVGILYLRGKRKKEKPFVLEDAVMLMPHTLALKMGFITCEDIDLIREKDYLRRYSDLNTEIYLTESGFIDDELGLIENTIKIISNKGERYIIFRHDIPNFSEKEEGGEPPIEGEDETEGGEEIDTPDENEGISLLSDEIENPDQPDPEPPDENDPLPPPEENIVEIDMEVLEQFYNEYLKTLSLTKVFIPYSLAVEYGFLIDESGEVGNVEAFYNDITFYFYNPEDDMEAWYEDDNVLVFSSLPEKIEKTDEEKFIEWFKEYFYSDLLINEDFTSNLNYNRSYVILLHEKEDIGGIFRLHRGWYELDMFNHNYLDIINKDFPSIREHLATIPDESFGGFEEDNDKGFEQEHKARPPKGHFGGFVGDNSFLI